MNIVGVNKETGKVFESQSYKEDAEKEAINEAIQADADSAEIEIEIVEMSDEELQAAISS